MDTIFALATPPGKSGVAVIRISGLKAADAVAALLRAPLPAPRMAALKALYETDGALIDKALVLWFPGPHSFTGEDVAELHVHGSRAVIKQVFTTLSAMEGLRPAEAGEFTRRAFVNGKVDLTEAEGLADLIDAETEAQQKQALRHMQGDARVFYETLRENVVHALAYLEAYIDFPDEDIPEGVFAEINKKIQDIIRAMDTQLSGSAQAQRIRDGIHIAILGPPNVGKSSLMNRLAGRDVAIVSHIAGTTRDVIEVHLDIGGYCVVLSDTAGIRDSADTLEAEGIRRSHMRASEADIRIVVMDSHSNEKEIAALVEGKTLLVYNKADIFTPSPLPVIAHASVIALSAQTRQGIDDFMQLLEASISQINQSEPSFVTQARHRQLLESALHHLTQFSAVRLRGLELQCEELRRAAADIGKITGQIAVDELLGHIFSRFCIGK